MRLLVTLALRNLLRHKRRTLLIAAALAMGIAIRILGRAGQAGVGLVNAMLMSVRERAREIGTLRALGMRRSRVVYPAFSASRLEPREALHHV